MVYSVSGLPLFSPKKFGCIQQHSLKLLSIVKIKSNYDICDNNLYEKEKEESRRSSNISKINHDHDKGRKLSKSNFLKFNIKKK